MSQSFKSKQKMSTTIDTIEVDNEPKGENGNLNHQKFKESDAGDGTKREDHVLHGTKLWLCASSLLMCLFLVSLDQMITMAVLTTISEHFNEFNKFTWITAAFMMPLGCLSQFWARLSISFGRKWVMLIGVALFEIGSLVAGIASSMNMFIGGRAIQGAGGSCIQSLTMIIVTEITTIDNRAQLLACVSIVFIVASVLGPLIGGVFGTNVSWRWCFYINLCFGAVIVPLFYLSYKPTPPNGTFKSKMKTIDLLDNFLLIAGFVLVLIAISFGQTDSKWGTAKTISCFVIGGIIIIIFCYYNFTCCKYPVIPKNIMFNKRIFSAFMTYSFSYSVLMVMAQFLCMYAETVLGHNPLHTGFFIIPCAIATCGASVLNAFLIKKTRYIKPFCVFGAIILPISPGLCQLLKVKEHLGLIIGLEILLGVGDGFNFQGPILSANIHAPKDAGSTILTTAFLNFGRSTMTAFFSEIGSAIYSACLKSSIKEIAPYIHETIIPLQTILLEPQLLQKLDAHDKQLILEKVTDALKNVFWFCTALACVSLVSAILLPSARVPPSEEVEK